MNHYLFVHFRETTSPEGEQVYFALSRDGFTWTALNDGKPILWAYYGDKGVRDMTIVRDRNTGRFHIFATDLSLSYGMRGRYAHSWANIRRHGSKALAHWQSDDLLHWTEEELIPLGDEDFGCLWAPDVLWDGENGEYLLHWSSAHRSNDYGPMAIYASRTKDFKTFSKPEMLYRKPDGPVIDSAMYEENGKYYLFLKSEHTPANLILVRGDHAHGPFERVSAFDEAMSVLESGLYEAPTAVKLDDGRWCLFIDFYGARGAAQGYVPFVATSLEKADFVRSDAAFSFPYGFKHGTILTITPEEYERMMAHDYSDMPDLR
ncbi:MAG: glycoside hydrolase family 43 protein [Clostridia bacterium]|nr:glycoside hydrolase family 43 protein [Clostridia bacterium]